MLKIINTISQLKFSKLMCVYSEGNLLNGSERYPYLSQESQIREVEQDFYNYLNEVFFRIEGAFYALWEVDGSYLAALRMEPYRDGWLLCALETALAVRRRGYATLLVSSVLKYLSQREEMKIYSHVSKRNLPSIATHAKCGFHIHSDCAVYLDGSVHHNCYTFVYDNKKSEA